MTYFHMGNPHYHWRGVVSLSCSGWEGVGPTRYGRQTKLASEDRRRRTDDSMWCGYAATSFLSSVFCCLSSDVEEVNSVFDCTAQNKDLSQNQGFHLNPRSFTQQLGM